MTHHLELFGFRLERQREDVLRRRLIGLRSDIVTMIMVEGTRLNSSRIYTPTRRERYCGKTAKRGQKREASVKYEHNHDKRVKWCEIDEVL
jgi:hypothetical protein